jgi:hypothetical protein
MENILSKIVDFLIAACVASMIALTMGYVAHYVFGLSPLDVRTSALTGAAILALIVAREWRQRGSKSCENPIDPSPSSVPTYPE